MSLAEVKSQIDRGITEYTGRFITHHKKRAENLRLGVVASKSWNELIMVLTNENNLLEGKGCVNQYSTEGYWDSPYSKNIKNVSTTGAYYELVNSSLRLVQDSNNISRESVINVANTMNYERFDRSSIYPRNFQQSILMGEDNRFSISPFEKLNERKELISELWSTNSKEINSRDINERYEAEKIGDLLFKGDYPFGHINEDLYHNDEALRLKGLLMEGEYSIIISKKKAMLEGFGVPVPYLMILLKYVENGGEIPEDKLIEFIKMRDQESLKLLNTAIEEINTNLTPLLDILRAGLGNLGEFFYYVLSEYFLKLNNYEKLWVNSSVLRSPELHREDVNFEKTFPICLMRVGGPYYHKICQLIAFAGRGSNNEALKTFESALNGLNPLSNDYLYEIKTRIEKSNPKLNGLKFIKTLGKASIGVAFLAKCNHAQFVIKVIRPDLTGRCNRDREIFNQIANDTNPNVLTSITPIMDSIDQELSFDEEMDNMAKGQVYRQYPSLTKGPSIQICNVIQKERGVPYLIQSIAPGRTVNDWINDEFKFTLLNRLYDLSYVWFWEAIPGKGACHCDLHAGNMLFDYESKAITVIDFGNFTSFSKTQKKGIFRMMLSTVTGDWEEFLANFNNLLPERRGDFPQELKNRAYKACHETKVGNLSQVEAIQQILNKAVSLSVSVPEPIIKFSRTATMLQQAISSVIQKGLLIHHDRDEQRAIKNLSFEMAIGKAITDMLGQSKFKLISIAGIGNCYRIEKPKDFAPPRHYVDPDL